MAIRIISDDMGFRSLKPAWDGLVAKNLDMRVFQTFDWNYVAWNEIHKKAEERLFIIDAKRDGHPDQHVILPCRLTADGTLRFIGDGPSDVLGVIHADHADNWNNFYNEIFKFLSDQKAIKKIELVRMEPDSELLRYGSIWLPDVEIRFGYAYSNLTLPHVTDVFSALTNLTSKERSYLRSLLKKNSGRLFNVVSKENGNAFPREKILVLRNWMIENRVRNEHFLQEPFLSLVERMYECGMCELSVIAQPDGQYSYAAFRLPLHGRILFWIVLYKDARDTTIGDILYIKEIVESSRFDELNGLVFDFGLGAYDYKLGTFRPEVSQLYSLVSRTHYRPTLSHFIKDFLRLCKCYVRAMIRSQDVNLR